ncbi:tetratricopeptide repeat protein 36 [Pogona vitticeps]|uniref:Tetratricopeptide repeat protein 36 n=1 Tax=Pogona vitticeps TaxID=103695 RepID=A0A6J0TSH6_9SAUR|nr:tetratricopeptide repeat protein 36 [Pogona vitticeps]
MATAHDRAVLRRIFHPDAPFGELSGESEEEELEGGARADDAFDPQRLEEATRLEMQGVTAAEAGDLDDALESFGRAIELLPERASAYNNRAQAFRLKGDVASALEDLETVLRLSQESGPVARQGFVQRGLIQRLRGREEEARRDFEQAARLGSPFARQQLVRMNPYSALCNQMLSEVMKQLRGRQIPPGEASSGVGGPS